MTETRIVPVKTKGPLPLYLDDVVTLRKPHPCGGDTWRIVVAAIHAPAVK